MTPFHSEPHTPAGEVALGAADRGCVTVRVPHDSDPHTPFSPGVLIYKTRPPGCFSQSNPGRVYRSPRLSKTQLKWRAVGGGVGAGAACGHKMEKWSFPRNPAMGGSLPRGSPCSDFHALNPPRVPETE